MTDKIWIEDDVVVEKHDVWKSEIRVNEDKAVAKILKHFKNPKGKNRRGKIRVTKIKKAGGGNV